MEVPARNVSQVTRAFGEIDLSFIIRQWSFVNESSLTKLDCREVSFSSFNGVERIPGNFPIND